MSTVHPSHSVSFNDEGLHRIYNSLPTRSKRTGLGKTISELLAELQCCA